MSLQEQSLEHKLKIVRRLDKPEWPIIELDLEDKVLEFIVDIALEKNITLDEVVSQILKEYID